MFGGGVLLAGCGGGAGLAAERGRNPDGNSPADRPGARHAQHPRVGRLRGRRHEGADRRHDRAGKSYIDEVRPRLGDVHVHHRRRPGAAEGDASGPFDLHAPLPREHPGLRRPATWSSRGTPSLLPSFKQLNPYLVERGTVKGKQYMIPWDWGYARSPTAPTRWTRPTRPGGSWPGTRSTRARSRCGAARRRTSRWRRSSSAYPEMDNLTDDQLEQSKQALIEQKPLNKFYWESEYGQMQPAIKSGDVWIAYSWQDTLVTMKAEEPGGRVPAAEPGRARLVLRLHARQGHGELLPRARVRRVVHQQGVRRDGQPLLLRERGRDRAAERHHDKALAKRLQLGDPQRERRPACTCRAGRRTGPSCCWPGRRSRPPKTDDGLSASCGESAAGRPLRTPFSAPGRGWLDCCRSLLPARRLRRPARPDRALQRRPAHEHPRRPDDFSLVNWKDFLPPGTTSSGTASRRRWSSRCWCRCSPSSPPTRSRTSCRSSPGSTATRCCCSSWRRSSPATCCG